VKSKSPRPRCGSFVCLLTFIVVCQVSGVRCVMAVMNKTKSKKMTARRSSLTLGTRMVREFDFVLANNHRACARMYSQYRYTSTVHITYSPLPIFYSFSHFRILSLPLPFLFRFLSLLFLSYQCFFIVTTEGVGALRWGRTTKMKQFNLKLYHNCVDHPIE
jgi:hypothetical protein